MTEVQELILELLVEIDGICKSQNIEYYLEAGTALGALRHGGFLPWDDDADIAMTRDNWDKFRDYVLANPPKDRALTTAEKNPLYPSVANRYVNTATTRIQRSLMYDICECGVAIDIFILEDAPDDDELLEQMKSDMIDYAEYICRYYRICSFGDSDRYRRLRLKGMLIGRKNMVNILDERVKKYNGIASKRYLMRWPYRFQIYDKDMFGRPTYVRYENTYLPIPEKQYEYMNYHYGLDWYMIPEAEDIATHDTVSDNDIGYETYVSDYMSLIDKKSAIRLNQRFKDLEMKVMKYNKTFHKGIYSTAGDYTAYILNKKISEENIDLDEEFKTVDEHSRARFEELFSDYLRKQMHTFYLFYQVYLPIDDDIFAAVISFLIRDGRLRDAQKLLDLRGSIKKPYSDKLQKVIENYDRMKQTTVLLFSRRFREAADYVNGLPEGSFLAPIQIAASCFGMLEAGDTEALKLRLAENHRMYPGEDMFVYLYGLVLMREGKTDKAGCVFESLMRSTKNGIIRLWIEQDPNTAETLLNTAP